MNYAYMSSLYTLPIISLVFAWQFSCTDHVELCQWACSNSTPRSLNFSKAYHTKWVIYISSLFDIIFHSHISTCVSRSWLKKATNAHHARHPSVKLFPVTRMVSHLNYPCLQAQKVLLLSNQKHCKSFGTERSPFFKTMRHWRLCPCPQVFVDLCTLTLMV